MTLSDHPDLLAIADEGHTTALSPTAMYREYTRGFSAADRRGLDSYLVGWLLAAVGEADARAALDAATEHVERMAGR